MRNTDSSPDQFWGLTDIEKRWVEVQPHLLTRGYQLRPRYRQGWQPSWSEGASLSEIVSAEDYIKMHPSGDVLDAVRISDNKDVVIKRTPANTTEVAIGQYLSSPALGADPANHCVPIYDTFPDPQDGDFVFIVMPLLRRWHDPQFRTIGEFLAFVDQLLEGLDFMHAHHVAHRDVASSNIMMDATAMYPEGFHPQAQYRAKGQAEPRDAIVLTRTQAPPNYYFIDFGISTQFEDGESPFSVLGNEGRTRAPELSLKVPYDPFKVDVFGMGEFLVDASKNLRGIEFLLPLASSMAQDNPQSRPTALQALYRFRELCQALPPRTSSQLLFHRNEGFFTRAAATLFDTLGLPGLSSLVAIGVVATTLAIRFRAAIFRTSASGSVT